jgi:amino acid transporter
MAMVFALLTFGGWNEADYISAELKNMRRNMLRALLLSIAAITMLYLLVNWAYWRGVGMAGMAASNAIAADLLRAALGLMGGTLIALLVALATLTSINATMIVGARTSFARVRHEGGVAAGTFRGGQWFDHLFLDGDAEEQGRGVITGRRHCCFPD